MFVARDGDKAAMSAFACEQHDALTKWLTDALSSERMALNSMLEQRHDAMLCNFQNLFQHSESQNVITVTAPQHKMKAAVQPRLSEFSDPISASLGVPVPTPSIGPPSTRGDFSSELSQGDIQAYRSAPTRTSFVPADLARFAKDLDGRSDSRSSVPGESQNWKNTIMRRSERMAAILIVVNVIVMSLERQYISFDLGHYALDYKDRRPSEETWPGAGTFFNVAEWVIGIVFAAEALLMLCILQWRYFTSGWQLFDALVVVSWALGRVSGNSGASMGILLRVAKLVRIGRVLRLVRTVAIFDSLHLLLKAVKSSIMVLFWSLLLLLLVIVVISLVISQLLERWIQDETYLLSDRTQVYEHWGSFSRSVETLFEVTLGNWGPPCRLLQDKVNEWWMVVIVSYKCIIGFAVVQVITSVFIQQTFKVVARDEDVMIREKKAASESYLRHLENLFTTIDESKDGYLCQEELDTCLEDNTVRAWFGALDIDVKEASTLFKLLDRGDGRISRKEFVDGIKTLRGPAKNMDMMHVLQVARRIEQEIIRMKSERLTETSGKAIQDYHETRPELSGAALCGSRLAAAAADGQAATARA